MGKPDQFSPYQFCPERPRINEMKGLSYKELPFDIKSVKIVKNSRGIQICLPLSKDEQLYGFGMQIGSFEQPDKLPLFVKAGSIIPIAQPLNYVANNTVFRISCKVFGDNASSFVLWEDDGVSFDFEQGKYNKITLSVVHNKETIKREGKYSGKRYNIVEWKFIK